jgi:hypothetical protein
VIEKAPKTIPDRSDNNSLIHPNNSGSFAGKYIQSPPLIFSSAGHSMWFGDMYRGRYGFLILGGPSFKELNHDLLNQPGILTMGVNNSPKTFRPDLWTSVDNPTHFIKSIWLDPKIMKFVPLCYSTHTIFDNEKWIPTDTTVGDCPNVWFFRRNATFNHKQFLFEDTFNWGNDKDHGGARSVMLVAIRLMYYLGVRNLFLLGCDFHMDENTKYHFEQDRSRGSINGNNSTYKTLIERFTQLKPTFDEVGFNIYNCNRKSGLKVFPFVDYNEAINIAKGEMPEDITNERTSGLYDRLDSERKGNKDDRR